MSVPESLEAKLDLFRAGGRVFRYEDDLFGKTSWVAVMLGQNIIPEIVDPIVASLPPEQIERSLKSMTQSIGDAILKMPTHEQFIEKYCRSEMKM